MRAGRGDVRRANGEAVAARPWCRRKDVVMTVESFAAEIVRSPAGVALLQGLEVVQRSDLSMFESPTTIDAHAVEAAIHAAETMLLDELLHQIVHSADRFAGPWVSGVAQRLALAYELAPARMGIAHAVAAKFEETLHAAVWRTDQQWWLSAHTGKVEPAFTRRRGVYCCGEFTRDSVWTVSSPPDSVHDDLIDLWEMFPTRAHHGWELSGPNQHPSETRPVEQASAGAAARHDVVVAMPHWQHIARDYDGVHLSWAGMMTCEEHVIDVPELGKGVVSMVRYWASERTLWLNDVLDIPAPLDAPSLSGRINGETGIDAHDPTRRPLDAHFINSRLGRQAIPSQPDR